ncbi:hypothetical protein H6504_05805 [Candidatus Woesearchaeota archaeon]|nr:hypothetical protein [Candidatus Woesearchaeota archaeon]
MRWLVLLLLLTGCNSFVITEYDSKEGQALLEIYLSSMEQDILYGNQTTIWDPSDSGWTLIARELDTITGEETSFVLYGVEISHHQMRKWDWNDYQDYHRVQFYLVQEADGGKIIAERWTRDDWMYAAGRMRYDADQKVLGVRLGQGSSIADDFELKIDLGINRSCDYIVVPCASV